MTSRQFSRTVGRPAVPELVRAAGDPRAVALRTADTEITYAELWNRARSTAADLSALRIGAGDLVAIQLPSGPDVVVGMLATWLAGAAFLPMDADAPAGYRDRLLAASGASALVDGRGIRSLLPAGAQAGPVTVGPDDRPAYVV